MKVIAFTGMPGSGKSEAVAIGKASGIPVFRMGDLVWEEVKRRGLPLEDATVGAVATEERKKYGYGVWAQRTVDKIRSLRTPSKIVIDGVRNAEEAALFKKELGDDFTLIAIVAPKELRFARLTARNREDEAQPQQLEARDKREMDWGLDNVIQQADITINNEGSLEELREKIKSLFSES